MKQTFMGFRLQIAFVKTPWLAEMLILRGLDVPLVVDKNHRQWVVSINQYLSGFHPSQLPIDVI